MQEQCKSNLCQRRQTSDQWRQKRTKAARKLFDGQCAILICFNKLQYNPRHHTVIQRIAAPNQQNRSGRIEQGSVWRLGQLNLRTCNWFRMPKYQKKRSATNHMHELLCLQLRGLIETKRATLNERSESRLQFTHFWLTKITSEQPFVSRFRLFWVHFFVFESIHLFFGLATASVGSSLCSSFLHLHSFSFIFCSLVSILSHLVCCWVDRYLHVHRCSWWISMASRRTHTCCAGRPMGPHWRYRSRAFWSLYFCVFLNLYSFVSLCLYLFVVTDIFVCDCMNACVYEIIRLDLVTWSWAHLTFPFVLFMFLAYYYYCLFLFCFCFDRLLCLCVFRCSLRCCPCLNNAVYFCPAAVN